MDMDRETRGLIKYYNCSKLDYIAKQCWYKEGNVRRIKEEKTQKALKENRNQQFLNWPPKINIVYLVV